MVALATKRFDANAVGYINQWSDEAGGAVAAADVTTRSSPAFSGAYIDSNSAADVRQAFTIDTTFVEKMAFVSEVRVHAYHRSNAGTSLSQRLLVRINATNVEGSAFNSTTTPTETSEAFARPGGGDWTEDDFRLSGANAFNFGCFHPSQTPEDIFIDELWVEVDYIPLNRQVEPEREIASRKLLLESSPEPLIKVIGGWDHAAAELMGFVGIAHSRGPSYDGTGWGTTNWKRAIGRLRAQNIDLLNPRIESIVGDRRRYMVTLWELMAAVIASDPDVADGLPRLDAAGADREFERSSKAWVEQVGGLIDEINEAEEKIEPTGTLIEGERTNLMTQSSFVNGTTGWTKVDDVGTSTLQADTDDLLFTTDVTAQSLELDIASTPNSTRISRASESLSGSTAYTISFDYKTTLNITLTLRIQNDTTANYLQTDGSWGASPDDASIPNSSSAPGRYQLTFTTEGTASTHTVTFVVGGQSAADNLNIYHVQIEAGTYATSRIVTEASAVTRAADNLTIDNSSSLAQRIWPVDKFTAKVVFTPEWDSDELAGNAPLFQLFHDSDNAVQVFHNTSAQIIFRYRHGGTDRDATFASPSLTKGTEHTAVMRFTSTAGEHGLPSRTVTGFLDGTAGTGTAAATGTITQATGAELYLGRNAVPVYLNGWLKEIKISPVVFSDEEIAAGNL